MHTAPPWGRSLQPGGSGSLPPLQVAPRVAGLKTHMGTVGGCCILFGHPRGGGHPATPLSHLLWEKAACRLPGCSFPCCSLPRWVWGASGHGFWDQDAG